ncbi:hypothetical protein HanRHA438_Chr04g0191551 [Helianthus annuus]|nr:hypothetical protein HanIR_Chr04g0195631 [Helianthus annuus]KAJ0758733.1 hypothetical protein HanLR1_Chr04g0153681 [Helianthus annuus]KAJ0928214.1 hypothetical protein HanRHA438_Chr04g0191551 [Helianthus annuus]
MSSLISAGLIVEPVCNISSTCGNNLCSFIPKQLFARVLNELKVHIGKYICTSILPGRKIDESILSFEFTVKIMSFSSPQHEFNSPSIKFNTPVNVNLTAVEVEFDVRNRSRSSTTINDFRVVCNRSFFRSESSTTFVRSIS